MPSPFRRGLTRIVPLTVITTLLLVSATTLAGGDEGSDTTQDLGFSTSGFFFGLAASYGL